MATHKSIDPCDEFEARLRKHDGFICDNCGSFDVKDLREGYTCRACGMVLEIPKMEYHPPYDARRRQHEPLRGTTLGSKRERERFFSPTRIKIFNMFGSDQDYNKVVLERASLEIARIFNALDLPGSKKETVLRRFAHVWEGLDSRVMLRGVEKLAPLITYLTLKLENVVIRKKKLLEVAHVGRKEFDRYLLQILRFFPEYPKRYRQGYVLNQLNGLREHFLLRMDFIHRAKPT